MFKNIIIAGLLSVSSLAMANKYSCSNVGGVEEWTIYVDLKKKLAGFFDNDTTTVVKLKEIQSLESFPPQTQYIFSETKFFSIRFNKTKMTASVTYFDDATREEVTEEALNGCKLDSNVDLE